MRLRRANSRLLPSRAAAPLRRDDIARSYRPGIPPPWRWINCRVRPEAPGRPGSPVGGPAPTALSEPSLSTTLQAQAAMPSPVLRRPRRKCWLNSGAVAGGRCECAGHCRRRELARTLLRLRGRRGSEAPRQQSARASRFGRCRPTGRRWRRRRLLPSADTSRCATACAAGKCHEYPVCWPTGASAASRLVLQRSGCSAVGCAATRAASAARIASRRFRDAGQPSGLDDVLREIYARETNTHITTVRAYLDREAGLPDPHVLPEDVYRACHTLSGSSKMAQARHGIRIAEPLDHWLRRAFSSGLGLTQPGPRSAGRLHVGDGDRRNSSRRAHGLFRELIGSCSSALRRPTRFSTSASPPPRRRVPRRKRRLTRLSQRRRHPRKRSKRQTTRAILIRKLLRSSPKRLPS